MKIDTREFGLLDYEESAVLLFPEGLMGLEHLHRFLILDQDAVEPLRWLQSVDEPAIAFPVIDPGLVFPDYHARMSHEDREALGLQPGEEPIVLALVTVPKDPAEMTANLLGPLVLNPARHVGRQVVQHDSQYGTRQRLIPDAAEARDVVTV
ncbi:MAG TPA: flagellar assembly protein FliW [Stenomitos sp.]